MRTLRQYFLARRWRRYVAAYWGVAAVVGVAAIAGLSIHFGSTTAARHNAPRPGLTAPMAPPRMPAIPSPTTTPAPAPPPGPQVEPVYLQPQGNPGPPKTQPLPSQSPTSQQPPPSSSPTPSPTVSPTYSRSRHDTNHHDGDGQSGNHH